MEDNQLIAVIQVFRHGARVLVGIYPNNPRNIDFYYPFEEGEITNDGKRGIYELGRFTRQRYQHFLPQIYSSKHFRVSATSSERTNVSAQVFAAGLYPPTKEETWDDEIKWNPIPVHTNEPSVLSETPGIACPRYLKAYSTILADTVDQFMQHPLRPFIEENSGMKFNGFLDIVRFFDNCHVEDVMGLEQQEWVQRVYPEMCGRSSAVYFHNIVRTDEMKRFFIGPFLHKLVQHFEKMSVDSSSGPKLLAYSVHDMNLAPLLIVLGDFDAHIPEFASCLFFELRKKNGEDLIKIFYKRQQIEPIKIAGRYTEISLKDFKQLMDKYIIDEESFSKECVLDDLIGKSP